MIFSAVAALAVALALQISGGASDTRALPLLAVAAALALAAVVWRRRGSAAASVVLGAGCAAELAWDLFTSSTTWLSIASLVLLSAYLCLHLRASLMRARFLLLLVCFLVMGAAVLRGQFSMLALTAAVAWLMARGIGSASGELAMLLVLFQPGTLQVIEKGWIDAVALALYGLVFVWGRLRAWRNHAALVGVAYLLALILLKQANASDYWLCVALLAAAAAPEQQ